jgi:hypothetical protein
MHRRAVLGTLTTVGGVLLAGCSGSSIDGEVVENETPLAFTHEHATQATPSGMRIVVDVTVENDGDEPITPESRVPRVVCAFLDANGETLHRSGLELVETVAAGGTTALEFTLAVDTDDVARYEIQSEWVEP